MVGTLHTVGTQAFTERLNQCWAIRAAFYKWEGNNTMPVFRMLRCPFIPATKIGLEIHMGRVEIPD